jgi:hypothetical protein
MSSAAGRAERGGRGVGDGQQRNLRDGGWQAAQLGDVLLVPAQVVAGDGGAEAARPQGQLEAPDRRVHRPVERVGVDRVVPAAAGHTGQHEHRHPGQDVEQVPGGGQGGRTHPVAVAGQRLQAGLAHVPGQLRPAAGVAHHDPADARQQGAGGGS